MQREIIHVNKGQTFGSRNEQKGRGLRMNLACLRDHSGLVWLEQGEEGKREAGLAFREDGEGPGCGCNGRLVGF